MGCSVVGILKWIVGQSCRRSDWTQSKVDAEDISNSMKKLEPQSLLLLLILLQIPRLIPATSLEKVTEDS